MADSWFVGRGGQRSGPFPTRQLREMAEHGRLAPSDLVWQEGMADWVQAASITGIFPAGSPAQAGSTTSNPYAAPAPQRAFGAARGGDQTAAALAAGGYSFSAAISLAMHTFTSQWVTLLLFGLVMLGIWIAMSVPQGILQGMGAASGDERVVGLVAPVASALGFIIGILVGGPFFAGCVVAAANATAGRGRVADMFLGFKRYGTVLLATVLVFLISLVVTFVCYIPMILAFVVALATRGPNGDITDLGGGLVGFAMLVTLVLTLLGVALVLVRVGFAPAITADPENGAVGAVDAVRLNWARTSVGKGFSLLGLGIIATLIMVLSVFLLCVGYLLLGLPVAIATLGAAYRLLFRGDAAPRAA